MTPLFGSQIYEPDEVHLQPIRFVIFYLKTIGRGGVRFTTYKQDGNPHPVNPVNNL